MNDSSRHHIPASRHRGAYRMAMSAMAIGLAFSISACGTSENIVPVGYDAVETPASEASGEAAPQEGSETGPILAKANLADVDGKALGEVTFTQDDGSLQVSVSVEGMKPGFYGLHVHGIGKCQADSAAPDDPSDTGAFKSSGGHIPGDGAKHPNHAGDLPSLLVRTDGTATMSIATDRLKESLLLDTDGAAVVIHAKPDNFANIPERYAPKGPDEDTTGAGDAGERLACGVVES